MKQGVYELSDTKQYPFGTYVRKGGKGFIYARAGGALDPALGAKQGNNQKFIESNIAAAVLAGATTVTVTITAGATVNSPILLNELAGGQFVAFPAGDNTFTRGIVSNSALAAGGILTIVLDAPVPVAVGLVWCEAIINPYASVINENNGFTPVMGMPMIRVVEGQYLWLQVEGPGQCAGDVDIGGAANALEAVFAANGSLTLRRVAIPGEQRAGMVITPNPAGNARGTPFIMFNIDH